MKRSRLFPLLIVAVLFAGLGWMALAPAPQPHTSQLAQPTSVAPPPPVGASGLVSQ